jgi:hypothetical protein
MLRSLIGQSRVANSLVRLDAYDPYPLPTELRELACPMEPKAEQEPR